MALIKCPECEKEISDQASVCPNCAYPIMKITKQIESNRKWKKRKRIIISGVVASILVAVLICVVFKYISYRNRNPFEILQGKITRDEVRKKLGKPDVIIDENSYGYNRDIYNSKTIFGLDGELGVSYTTSASGFNPPRVGFVYWCYDLPKGKDLTDYQDKITEIEQFLDQLTKTTGKDGLERNLKKYWRTETGNEYDLLTESGKNPNIRIAYVNRADTSLD